MSAKWRLLLLFCACSALFGQPSPREPVERYVLRKLQELARSQGIELKASGIRWNLFVLSATLDHVTLASTANPDLPPVAYIESVSVNFSYSDLFAGDYTLQHANIVNPLLHLVIAADGRSNIPRLPPRRDTNRKVNFLIEELHSDALSLRFQDLSRQLDLTLPRLRVNIHGDPQTRHQEIRLETWRPGSILYGGRTVDLGSLSLDSVFGQGRLQIRSASVGSAGSRMDFSGQMTNLSDPRLDLSFNTALDLSPLLRFLGVSTQLAGKLTGQGTMRGPWKNALIQAKVHGEDVDALGFAGITADADTEYMLLSDRLRVPSFRARSRLGVVQGQADVALKNGAGRTTIRTRMDGLEIEQVTRRFKLPVHLASRATGTAVVWWPGVEAEQVEGDVQVALTPSRAQPAEDVLPAGGSVTAAIRGKRLVADLNPLTALNGRVEGRVELTSWTQLAGHVRVDTERTGDLLLELARFLGRKEPLVDLQFAGPATATVDLAGSLKNPEITASAASPALAVGALRDIGLQAQIRYANDLLSIRDAVVRWRQQTATAAGTVSFRQGQRNIDIKAHVDRGDLQAVLKGLDLELPVTAEFTADAVIGGTVDTPIVDASATGTSLRAFSETLGSFSARARIENGTLALQQFQATQPDGGLLSATGTYRFKDRAYTLDASARALQLLDVKLPNGELVTGTATFTAKAGGTVDQPQLDARLDLSGLQVGARSVGNALATLALSGQQARFEASVPQFSLTATGTASTVKPYSAQFQVRAQSLNLATLPLNLPRPLTGTVSATVEGAGEIENWRSGTLHALIESANADFGGIPIRVDGPAALEYANERFTLPQPVSISSGKSRVTVEGSIPLENRTAPGSLSVKGDVELRAVLGLIPAARPLDATGVAHLDVAVTGSMRALDPRGTVTVEGGSFTMPDLGFPPFFNINLALAVQNGAATLQRLTADWGPATMSVTADLPLGLLASRLPFQIVGARQGNATFKGDLNNLQLLAFASLPKDLGGAASVHVEGSASRLALDGIDARATFPQLELNLANYKLQETGTADITLANGMLRVARLELKGPETNMIVAGSVPLADSSQAIDLRLSGTTDAAVLFFFTQGVRARGPARIEATATGPLRQPQLNGFLELTDAQLSLSTPRLIAEDLQLRADLSGNRVNITSLHASLNGGTATGSGGFTIAAGGLSDFKINLKAQNVNLDYPEGLRTISNFDISLLGFGQQYVLDGAVEVQEGSYTRTLYFEEEIIRRLRGGGSLNPQEDQTSFLSRLRFNLRIKTIEPLAVQNNLAKAEVALNLLLVGTYQRPGLTGRLEVLEGGQIYLGSRKFLVTRAAINFTNENRIEPVFDLLATTQVTGYELTLQLTGSIGDLTTNLTADDPTITQPQALALLLTGRLTDNVQAAESEGARQQLVALLAGSLTGRITQEFQQTLGLSEVRIDPSLISPEQNPTARLTVGQNINRQLSFIYSMDLSNASNQTWIAEYDITRRFMTQGIKQDDNSYRFEFRHDYRFGGTPFQPIPTGRSKRLVGDVTFAGNTYFTTRQLEREFKVKPGQKYDYFRIRKGLDALQHMYAKADLLEARIRLQRDQHGDKVNLNLHVTPGPKVNFVYEGWDVPGGTRDRVRSIWQQGVFEVQRADEAQDAIRETLIKEGYLKGSVAATIQNADPATRRVLFDVQPGVRFNTVKFVFNGAKAVEGNELEKVVKKAKLENAVYTRPEEVSALLRRYYRDQGFLTAEIGKAELDLEPEARTAKVVIPVTEGPRFRVGKIEFEGSRVFTREYQLNQIALTEGEEYNPDLRERSYLRLQDLYWAKGYNDVEISYLIQPREGTDLVDVKFQIKENKQRVVKSIDVEGYDYTSRNLTQTQLAFRVGDVLTNERLSRSRRNLYITGAFVMVEIETKDLPEQGSGLPENQRPVAVTVTVHEVQPYQIRYGGFYDTERGPGAIADFTTYNTLGSARSLGLRTRYDSQLKEARLYFGQPILRRFPIKTTAVGYVQQENRPSFTVRRVGVSVQEEARWARHNVLSFGYQFEHSVTREAILDPLFPFEVSVRLAPVSATFTRETRDDILNPTRGSFLSQAFEYAPAWLGSQVRFARYYGQYYHYVPLQKPTDVPFSTIKKPRLLYAGAIRVGLAGGIGGQDLIPSERFFAGGGTTIRGFAQDTVGPQIAGIPTGGNAQLIINNELRFPLWKWFDGVAFLDIGNVYPKYTDFSITNIRKAGGLGVRLRTPYVMLRLDYGIKLDRRSGESFGQLFFSIGQAF